MLQILTLILGVGLIIYRNDDDHAKNEDQNCQIHPSVHIMLQNRFRGELCPQLGTNMTWNRAGICVGVISLAGFLKNCIIYNSEQGRMIGLKRIII
jgi:hypothetical protein